MSTRSLKGITGSSGVPGPFGDIYDVWRDSDFGPGVFGSSNENGVSSTDRADLLREGVYHA